ncbi:helix-turn-helix domain-containing protein [Riemerella anatipestifer]|uniref:helix-turn-helix domain-containing protein n=1 Tax=Riemerella anatipestifer TaxID=34085 RepID=UPI002363EADB|nr:helix-turn-helix transcriptional regulator [Riemerella anatipestifer]MDD1539441.1 helix-turn-helix transcriptional regulator [Riemerella anatipestifer]
MNAQIIDKIKKLRISKGFSHAEMADKLCITRSAYQRLESGETYSWAKYLRNLMDIFETSPKEFFYDIGKKDIYQHSQDISITYIESLYQENKEVYKELLKSKDNQIELLKEQVNFYKSQLE